MIYLGADHAGFELKEEIKKYLQARGLEMEDLGAHAYEPEDDYPDFILPVAERVGKDPDKNRGIVLGGSGQGEAIAANKVPGVYAAHYYGGQMEIVEFARRHNNANVLSLGARFLERDEAIDAVRVWLETPFDGERHDRRLKKIQKFEQK